MRHGSGGARRPVSSSCAFARNTISTHAPAQRSGWVRVRIPHQFHFVFGLKPQLEPFHLLHHVAIASCQQVNRPERIYFHYQHEPWGAYWELTKPLVTPVRVEPPAFMLAHRYRDRQVARYRYAHYSDVVRLEQLLVHGGVYADIDTLFLRPLPARLFEKAFVIGRELPVPDPRTGVAQPSLCNALQMAEPDAAFGREWLRQMETAFDGRWSTHSCTLPQQLADRQPGSVHIEPPGSFYPLMWTRDDLRALLEEKPVDLGAAFSMHLWSHLWWEETRRDYSDVHAGLLTERYIAEANTTLAAAARPFLPPPRALRD
jgi:hypothetical protein